MDDLRDKINNYWQIKTLSELSSKTGVSVAALSRFLSGKQKNIPYSKAVAILKVVNRQRKAA